ncbi:hypothetical protein [Butyrivibrio proteoclasticus]|uniref:hypothetical protein n=1 Tax=Butyrivibrio proteoclasticus TaxID=43305 RepID=UPI00047C926D|nr:hypothetical protein [Butyrivibrio proteoclasticus]
MSGDFTMEIVKARLNADLLAPIISIPVSLSGKDVDVIITEANSSIVDGLYGVASDCKMSLDEIRDERLQDK